MGSLFSHIMTSKLRLLLSHWRAGLGSRRLFSRQEWILVIPVATVDSLGGGGCPLPEVSIEKV